MNVSIANTSGTDRRLNEKEQKKGAERMTHEAKITITLDPETGEVNFKFDFAPEADAKNPDGNKAAVIAMRMFQLLKWDGLVK
jgi:hypothetical protein